MSQNHANPTNIQNLNKLVQETAAIVAESNIVNIPSSSNNNEKETKTKIALYNKRKIKASDAACLFGGAGLILMVLENEFIINNVYPMGSPISYVVKGLISLLTIFLLSSICYYHFIEYLIKNWQDGLTPGQLMRLMMEILICSIHPIPGNFHFNWTIKPINSTSFISVDYRLDIILSLLMVSRLYLFIRSYLLHMKMFHGKFLVIGNLNAVSFDIGFKIKTLMTFYPGRVLLIFNTFYFFISSWYLRLTERNHDEKFGDFANCLWCVAVTFLTIGYGDLTPVTFLGRVILIITGFMGIASSALIIAVISQKLSLSKAEQLVHTYISNDKLKVQSKNSAAIVIQKAWFTYKYTKLNRKYNTIIQRRALCASIREFQRVKVHQRKQAINEDNQIENKQKVLFELQRDLYEMVEEIKSNQEAYLKQMKTLECNLSMLQTITLQNQTMIENMNIK